jgi:hypothetical protein
MTIFRVHGKAKTAQSKKEVMLLNITVKVRLNLIDIKTTLNKLVNAFEGAKKNPGPFTDRDNSSD